MIGTRIRLAREIAGFTQTELAEKIGTTQSGIASMEANLYRPSEDLLDAIGLACEFRTPFFTKVMAEEFPSGALLYRARATMPKAVRQRAHGLTTLAYDLAATLGTKLKRLPVNLPRLSEDPVTAARVTRAAFGIAPEAPISDLMDKCEINGVLVLLVPYEVEFIDGFSTWVGTTSPRPVLALLGGKSGYRTNFTMAEELGHLVLHSPLRTSIAEADIEARAFAQEFLMPSEAMQEEIQTPVTLSGLAPLKNRWRVSIQALIRRSKDLEIITSNQYRYLNQQIRVSGWSKSEPGDESIPQMRPRLLRKMAELVYGASINFGQFSADTGIPKDMLFRLLSIEINRSKGKLLSFKSGSSDETLVVSDDDSSPLKLSK